MNAIVTVVGKDRVGIIAAICNKLADYNVNILDISQTILQGSFTMVMAVDVSAATASFGDLGTALAEQWQEAMSTSQTESASFSVFLPMKSCRRRNEPMPMRHSQTSL